MSDNTAIKVKGVCKTFRVHHDRNLTLKERVLFSRRARHQDFLALDNVSFDIERGTTVGLIGMNGSGKSTMLKIISKILYPEQGSVEIDGRVSSLLELGAGFHPDFSGLENIYLNSALLGLSKSETTSKLATIIDFSELGDFINEPLRTYSSGMQMRLAFSVAIAVDPDILLLDEVIAVGDAPFQAKCMSQIRRLQTAGKTIVLVTHDTGVVERFCNKVVWLHNSRVRRIGSPQECIPDYLTTVFGDSRSGQSVMSFERSQIKDGWGSSESGDISQAEDSPTRLRSGLLRRIELGSGLELAETGRKALFRIYVQSEVDLKDAAFGIALRTEDGITVWGTNTFMDGTGTYTLKAGESVIVDLTVPELPLLPGTYVVDVSCHNSTGELFDLWSECSTVSVTGESDEVGLVTMKHNWNVFLPARSELE